MEALLQYLVENKVDYTVFRMINTELKGYVDMYFEKEANFWEHTFLE